MSFRLTFVIASIATALSSASLAADHLLSGAVTSVAGEKLAGVTVSAKAQGSTITTSVYTDEQGAYHFPPLPAGKYQVWAQALAFDVARSEVDLSAPRRQSLTLAAITDFE